MFNPRFRPRFFRIAAGQSHAQRVFDLYLKRHRDELLGFGYHQFMRAGRGALVLSCGYRDLFFGKGFYPKRQYLNLIMLSEQKLKGQLETSAHLATYNPETEMVVYLDIRNSDLYRLTRLSKKGLSLDILHRQYLNRSLNYLAIPGIVSP